MISSSVADQVNLYLCNFISQASYELGILDAFTSPTICIFVRDSLL